MPICGQCGRSFPNRVWIRGKHKNVFHRKRCLQCSPWGHHNTSPVVRGSAVRVVVCLRCGKSRTYKRNGGTKTYCPACYLHRRFTQMKQRAVKYKGGKCSRCGYSRFLGSLDFHHQDPGKKDFYISHSYCLSWDKLRRELDKCILVCRNCHGEIHGGFNPTRSSTVRAQS